MDTYFLRTLTGILVCLFFLTFPGLNCKRPKRLPLMEDKVETKESRLPGCWLGGTFYHLEQRWSPALLPHGTMVCVKCQCVPVEKKGVLQHNGHIVCRNIKNECPKPKCDSPILVPERCCKTCPGEDNDFEDQFTISKNSKKNTTAVARDDPDKALKGEYIALLVGRNVRGRPVKTKAVAVVRITVENGELRYAVRYNRLDRPKFLQIMDANGKVMLEKPLVKSRNGERKVCGVWHKIPTLYLQYLRERKLFAVITAAKHTKGLIAGRVVPHENAAKETFLVLLGSHKPEGIGGVASLEFDSAKQQVKYVISFDGLFDEDEINGEFYATVEKNTKIIHQSMGRVGKKVTTLSGVWKMNKRREAKQLARGRLLLRVTSRAGNSISGDIKPRLTCGVYQSVLSGHQCLKQTSTSAAGSAIIQLHERGHISYHIRVAGLESKITRIRLETAANKKGRRKIIANLHKTFKPDLNSHSGWANGTYKKLKADDIVLLLNNKLFINVQSANHKSGEIRGRIAVIPFHTHFASNLYPTTLQPVTKKSNGNGAHAWLSMDVGCSLHYDVMVAQKVTEQFTLMLGTYGKSLMSTSVLGKSDNQKPTTMYEFRMMSGNVNSVPESLLRDLDEGKAFLQVNSGDNVILSGNITLPNTCWNVDDGVNTDILVNMPGETGDNSEVRYRCYYEGTYYENGESWKPVENATCNRCSCNRGDAVCHPVLCPAITCSNPVPGECCPRCPDESEIEVEIKNETCKIDGDHRSHKLGETWHPFLPLQGFSKCVLCKCLPGGVPDCSRLPCPVLECPQDERIRVNQDDCCQVCGPKKERAHAVIENPLKDMNMEGACTFMEEYHADGSWWHPKIAPFGYMKCVVCKCKMGQYTCGRQKCPKLNCRRKIRKSNSCCYICDPNQPSEDDEVTENEGVCNFGGRMFQNGEKWRPKTAPNGTVRCAICKCKDSTVKCRIRCSKKRCAKDPFLRDPCCRECAARKKKKDRKSSSSKEQ